MSSNKDTAPPNGRTPGLVIIFGDDLGRLYNLNVNSAVIGRSAKCEICVDQESISRNHSKIVNTGKDVIVRDLGSTNGTYVNDELIEERVLRDGDLIKVGRTIFKFLGTDSIERAYHEKMFGLLMANRSPRVPSGDEYTKTRVMTATHPEDGPGRPTTNSR